MLHRTCVILLSLTSLASLVSAQTEKAPPKASDLETQLLEVLREAKVDDLNVLVKEIGKLKEEDRRMLPFRVRPGAVEFRFDGECPAHTTHIEFVLSNKNRDYESLLVLGKSDLQRAERLWKIVEHLAISGQLKNVTHKKFFGLPVRESALEFHLLFVVEGQPRTENVANILLKEDGGYLNWEDDGLRLNGDRNLDAALVPPIRQRAQMIVVVRPKFLNP